MGGRREPIAIIGSGCRFPGDATSPSKLWDITLNTPDLLAPIPSDRFSTQGFYHESGQYHGHSNVKNAYLLSGEGTQRHFDAQFFGINPAEASAMDPQVRLLLETVYESLEASGHTIEALQGSDTAMYTGLMLEDYERVMIRDEEYMGTYHITGTARSLLSNRISYFFDWHGPSMTIDTACSSSLVAVHQAVQQLRSGQSRVAVAAGANLFLDPQLFLSASKLGMLSPDGRSRMWDADANGYARGEGIAAVVLKTLSAAEADGDDIECIICETGTNQDGKTPGITMPNSNAQESLIRDCYTRAGLDPSNASDRPQYFEAHGTGTRAGDPIEAEAIHSVFFPQESHGDDSEGSLLVGSIKTVIGHTEGTAGIAGLLKASLAVQNKIIPPNLLFNRLNPRIEPFYQHLQVPTEATPWPTGSHPRRASVNSFGFGGSNAHAILESYSQSNSSSASSPEPVTIFTPFVFSAVSEKSLVAYLHRFRDYIEDNGHAPDLRNVAYTLCSRRSRFPLSVSLAASTTADLVRHIDDLLQTSQKEGRSIGVRTSVENQDSRKPRILGVFTGQGAQWARQGFELMQTSKVCRETIRKLELRLDRLPKNDRPSWSLLEELEKDATTSRIGEPAFSQPLCTAIQILQVDLVGAAGIKMSAVVGHSSGEIGAAYAAGMISAEDAICIAYYRGLWSDLAHGSGGAEGAMMAVEASYEDVQMLCESPEFGGRVCVAAVNSSASLTMSGDEDAIEALKLKFDEMGRFARVLRVNKAYHSHHMVPCCEPYLQSLAALNIQTRSSSDCTWFSSVHSGDMNKEFQTVASDYWVRNVVKPVLFKDAIEAAWESKGPFDMAVEIGPHPALKTPTLQIVQSLAGDRTIPYDGLFKRGQSAVDSVAGGLGFLWAQLGKGAVDLQNYDRYVSGDNISYRLVKGLPTYAWNHDTDYWHESRYARAMRTRSDPVHMLLGHLTPDSTKQEMRWRHLVRPKELQWLKGHQLQGQTVFPAAGYVVLVVEAAMMMCKADSVSLIEVLDLDIGRALTFDQDESSMEAIFSFTNIVRTSQDIEAIFTYNASPADGQDEGMSLDMLVSGRLRVSLGTGSSAILPARGPQPTNLLKVDKDDFYASLRDLEYQYSSPFDALSCLERKLGTATGLIDTEEPSEFLIHPATLDTAFQSIFLAHSAPFDGAMWTMHVPRKIQCIRVNPALCASAAAKKEPLSFNAFQPVGSPGVGGDVEIYSSDSEHALAQVEGLACVPISTATALDDREMFSTTVWNVADPDAELVAHDGTSAPQEYQLAYLLERIAVLHLRTLDRAIPRSHPSRHNGPYQPLFNYASHVLSLAQANELDFWKPEWNHDTHETLSAACNAFQDDIDIKLLNAIGESLPEIATGRTKAIEVGMQDNSLAQIYERGLGWPACTKYLARTVKQLVHRYPHLNILEVGAGTGGATKRIFEEVGQTFASYTFTDVSSGFFDSAREALGEQGDSLLYKVLDLTKDPSMQGFKEHSYDLVVASMVVHATTPLKDTMRNVRRLLKPGGYFIALEGQAINVTRLGALFGAFPDWWIGASDGRALSPFIGLVEWNELLRETGFSGCDTTTPNTENLVKPFTVLVSQAVDDRVSFLRDPLGPTPESFRTKRMVQDLILIGGATLRTSRIIGQLKTMLNRYCGRIRTVRSISDMSSLKITPTTFILSLAELDEAFFSRPTNIAWEAMKKMLLGTCRLLWITTGRLAHNPHANMTLGLLRTVARENPALNAQVFDIDDSRKIDSRLVAEALLRMNAQVRWLVEATEADLLSSIEPELVLNKKGQLVIPRLMVNQEMNRRYNSSRRPIQSNARRDREGIEIATSDSGLVLRRTQPPPTTHTSQPVHVSKTLLSAVRVADLGCMFLSLGRAHKSDQQLVVLSTTHASTVYPWQNLAVMIDTSSSLESDLLLTVSYCLISSVVLKGLTKGDSLIVNDPPHIFAIILKQEANRRGVRVVYTTSNMECASEDWLKILPTAPERHIVSSLPNHVSAFIDFGGPSNIPTLGDRIRSQLSVYCRCESEKTMFGLESWSPHDSHVEEIQDRLEDAVLRATSLLADGKSDGTQSSSIPPNAIQNEDQHLEPVTVVDWDASTTVPINVQPIDTATRFSSDRTYWLAGLSGGLGLSLCEWMVRHGARHLVLSSRRPKLEPLWLDKMEQSGAVVKILKCDMTKRDEVTRAYLEICNELPPIAGVAQGAMVLQDMAFADMSLEALTKVTKPKVDGSIYLNELFQDSELDFFVFFSSLAAVTGNVGQSNYSAANMFMCGLAEQRRQRGLAASVINIGPVLGVGYIAQQDTNIQSVVHLGGYEFISETDFHQLFAEAVAAGRPGSAACIEVTTGIRCISPEDEVQPSWASNPFMGHFSRNRGLVESAKATASARTPVSTQLAQAQSRDDVIEIIRNAFRSKLCTLYQLDNDRIAQEGLDNLHLDEMGTDSLLAVEIRSWFTKTLQVNIAVLKILGGASIGDLINIAADDIPCNMVPNMRVSDTASTGSGPRTPASPTSKAETESENGSEAQSHADGDYETEASSPPWKPVDAKDTSIKAIEPIFQRTSRLSFSQDMFWFVSNFHEDKTSMNHTGLFRLTGDLRRDDFKRALESVTQQHESLRTCFFEQDGQPMQAVMRTGTIEVDHRQIQSENDATRAFEELKHYNFDIERGETMKLVHLKLHARMHFLIVGAHGIAFDGLSLQVLLKDLQRHYTNVRGDYNITQYVDFTQTQCRDYDLGKLDDDVQFWKDELAGLPPSLPTLRLCTTTSRPVLTTYDNERVDIRIPAATRSSIQALCRRFRATPFHFYLATLRILLMRYTDADDFSIGIGDANREQSLMDSVGCFVNLLPLRFQTKSDDAFDGVLKDTRSKTYAALAHSRVPFQVLLKELDIQRSARHTPIFQAFIDYRQGQREKQAWGDCQLELLSFQASKLAYDLSLDIIDDSGGESLIMLIVRKDLYSLADAEKLANSYKRLVEAFSAQPSSTIDSPNVFDPIDVDQALGFSRGPSESPRWPETVVHRIEEIAAARPNFPAARLGDNTVTYKELNDRTNTIATALLDSGVQLGDRVAILQEPTIGWVASVLAIMRIGAACLPLDLGNPWSRLSTIANDCQPRFVLVDTDTRGDVDRLELNKMMEINISSLTPMYSSTLIAATADSAAVYLYTSGSSGTPKGCALSHRGLQNWFEATSRRHEFAYEYVMQQSSSNFDMSLIQTFTALCSGGCVCLVPRHLRGDARAITSFIQSESITCTFACPSEYSAWINYGNSRELSMSSWTTAVCGGEPVSDTLLEQFVSLERNSLRLFNIYGPTEVSFSATSMELDYSVASSSTSHDKVAAGFPLPNYVVYVTDECLRPVPVGMQGEIHIGGAGVTAGYLNNNSLTSEKFIANPFASPGDSDGDWPMVHRTGDVGRWRSDGALLVEGRVSGDTQVKLRGLRIDLREIESTLIKSAKGALSDAVVSVRRSSSNSPEMLVAHVVFAVHDEKGEREQISKALASQSGLPQYMCPSIIIPVDNLPLTASQKRDRRLISKWPLPESPGVQPAESKLTDAEILVKGLWEEVISENITNSHVIGPETDFFHIGGTSLLVLSLQARIRNRMNIEIPVPDMFNSSTLSGMARRIEGAERSNQLDTEIDWEAETRLSANIMKHDDASHPVGEDQKVVVLTGATGYLGKSLLEALIHDPAVRHVHCIAVRSARSRHELSALDKVTLYEGDLTLPRLGLTEEDATDIFSKATTIIHNGADVSYMKSYASLRLPNLESTKQLIEMCLPRLIPFHFISTAGACSFATAAGVEEVPQASVRYYAPSADGHQGYASSKWASEVFLEKVHGLHGQWPIWIHRPSNISREDLSSLDLVQNLQHYSQLLQALPAISESVQGHINSVTLNSVVTDVIKAVHTAVDFTSESNGTLQFRHEVSDSNIPLNDLPGWLLGSQNPKNVEAPTAVEAIKIIPLDEWAKRAGEEGMHPSLIAFLQTLTGKGVVILPKLVK